MSYQLIKRIHHYPKSINGRKVSFTEKTIVLALAAFHRADHSGSGVRISAEELGAFLSCSERTVRKGLKAAESSGLVKRVRRNNQHSASMWGFTDAFMRLGSQFELDLVPEYSADTSAEVEHSSGLVETAALTLVPERSAGTNVMPQDPTGNDTELVPAPSDQIVPAPNVLLLRSDQDSKTKIEDLTPPTPPSDGELITQALDTTPDEKRFQVLRGGLSPLMPQNRPWYRCAKTQQAWKLWWSNYNERVIADGTRGRVLDKRPGFVATTLVPKVERVAKEGGCTIFDVLQYSLDYMTFVAPPMGKQGGRHANGQPMSTAEAVLAALAEDSAAIS
ncbi:MAG: hypothetical protein ACR2QC_07035 [Gammaproteobacteria bacterium]